MRVLLLFVKEQAERLGRGKSPKLWLEQYHEIDMD